MIASYASDITEEKCRLISGALELFFQKLVFFSSKDANLSNSLMDGSSEITFATTWRILVRGFDVRCPLDPNRFLLIDSCHTDCEVVRDVTITTRKRGT
jgi:hypothetical protein